MKATAGKEPARRPALYQDLYKAVLYQNCTLGDCLPGVERVERLYTEAEKGGNQVAEFMCVGRVW